MASKMGESAAAKLLPSKDLRNGGSRGGMGESAESAAAELLPSKDLRNGGSRGGGGGASLRDPSPQSSPVKSSSIEIHAFYGDGCLRSDASPLSRSLTVPFSSGNGKSIFDSVRSSDKLMSSSVSRVSPVSRVSSRRRGISPERRRDGSSSRSPVRSRHLTERHRRHHRRHHECHRRLPSTSSFDPLVVERKERSSSCNFAGPTSFAPIIDAAIDIVEENNGQYHVLVIIADGQVTRSPDVPPGWFSPQEQATIDSIIAASHYPLSIVLVGVGDGPWDSMQQFDDNISQRQFDNFQFVNFTKIMSDNNDRSKKEAAFALAALMEIPFQYRATQNIQLNEKIAQGRRTRPLPPPYDAIDHLNPASKATSSEQSTEPTISAEQACPICMTSPRNLAFQCGHTTCKDCGRTLVVCPLCRQRIKTRIRLYT